MSLHTHLNTFTCPHALSFRRCVAGRRFGRVRYESFYHLHYSLRVYEAPTIWNGLLKWAQRLKMKIYDKVLKLGCVWKPRKKYEKIEDYIENRQNQKKTWIHQWDNPVESKGAVSGVVGGWVGVCCTSAFSSADASSVPSHAKTFSTVREVLIVWSFSHLVLLFISGPELYVNSFTHLISIRNWKHTKRHCSVVLRENSLNLTTNLTTVD